MLFIYFDEFKAQEAQMGSVDYLLKCSKLKFH